jgi:hypothetical protein
MAYIQQLKTYTDRNDIFVEYEEVQIKEQEYKTRIILNNNNNKTTYDWSNIEISKKKAKNNAAKLVLIKLNLIKINDDNNNEDETENKNEILNILIEIRNLLKILVEKL